MNEFEILQKNISLKTISVANKMINAIDNYINQFNKTDIFSFSRKKDEEKKQVENYYLFLIDISSLITEITNQNAKLASLLIAADKKMQIDLIIICEKRLNAFEIFEQEFYAFTSSIEKAFSNNTASTAFLVNTAQKFKNSINKLISENI